MLKRMAAGILKISGWKIEAEFPDTNKYVIIGYPHTSNWDFIMMLLFKTATGLRLNWVGKKVLFKPPYGWIMRLLGGIPVDRTTPRNFVAETMRAFEERDQLILAMAPEGTRKRTEYWRRGFYYIAHGAEVPVALAYLDRPSKTIGIGKVISPSGNIQTDIEIIREFYQSKTGFNPEKTGEIRVRPGKSTT